MNASAEFGRNLVSKHQTRPEDGHEQADAGRDCWTRLAGPIIRRERGQRKKHFPCSADHEQDWQPYPVDPSLAICDDHTYKIRWMWDQQEKMILLTQCYHHQGTRWYAMKRFCLCSLWSHLDVLTFFPPDWGMLRRSRCVKIFLLNTYQYRTCPLHTNRGCGKRDAHINWFISARFSLSVENE